MLELASAEPETRVRNLIKYIVQFIQALLLDRYGQPTRHFSLLKKKK